MNTSIAKYILGMTVLLFLFSHSYSQNKLVVGEKAPSIEEQSNRGNTIKLSEINSELILLDFWAGWCKPCIKTIKSTLLPIYDKYDRKKLEIIGISYDRSVDKWKKSIARYGLPWLHIYDGDNNELLKKYMVEYIPTYFLVDRNGKIVAKNILSADLEKTIDEYFNKTN